MAQQTSSSWYSPHWHHNRFPQLAVVTGPVLPQQSWHLAAASSVEILTQVAQTEALLLYPRWWLQRLPFSQTLQCTKSHERTSEFLSSTSKLVDIQVNRQRLSFTGAYWGILGQSNTTSSYRQIYISTGGCSQSVG